MCGILYCKLKSEDYDTQNFKVVFDAALKKMHYRGPDAFKVSVHGSLFFGHVRLSIVDPKASSDQPYEDDEHLMIFNGEIYNHKEIDPKSQSDTRTLFTQMKNGGNPFSKLRGMFAFGMYNKQTQHIVFYRDFFGEKPLYYYVDKEIEVVSSTLKSILEILKALNKKPELNKAAINDDFLWFGFIREPKTIWNNIFAVPPGHQLEFFNDSPQFKPLKFNLADQNDWTQSTYLANALSSTDVEGALLLSEGIDSTFLLTKAIENSFPLKIGIYKANDPKIDESAKALQNIAKIKANPQHYPVTVLENNVGVIDIDEYGKILEQPSSDGLQLFNLLKYLRNSHPGLKLVYTGLGGDELFGGYPTFYNFKKINLLIKLPLVEYFLPALKRFKTGKRIVCEWNYDTYAFLYRLNYPAFKLLNGTHAQLISSYQSFKQTLAVTPVEINDKAQKISAYAIKRSETFDYARNQLLRDNDNISMYLGFESRSPLLNADWYNQNPDKKLKLKNALINKWGISFNKKKGFTLDERDAKAYYKNYIIDHQVFLNQILDDLSIPVLNNLSVNRLRALSVLASWVKHNADN